MKNLLKLVLCSTLLVAGAAQANLVQNDAVITDTSTNLDWMPLTASVNTTYNQMLHNFGDKSSAFYGYQYASLNQVETLFKNDGYTGDFVANANDAASRAAIGDIFALFGQTGSNCCARGDGMFLNEDGGAVGWLYYIPDLFGESRVYVFDNAVDPSGFYWDASSDNQMGSWIVKAHAAAADVPEPGSLALISLALGALALGRRRKQ